MWSGTTTELRDEVKQWISIEGILQSGTDPNPNRCEADEFILILAGRQHPIQLSASVDLGSLVSLEVGNFLHYTHVHYEIRLLHDANA